MHSYIAVKRFAVHQTLRSNHPAECSSAYYKVAYFLPYCDHLVEDLRARFHNSPAIVKGW